MIRVFIIVTILMSLTSCKSWFTPDSEIKLKDGTVIDVADLPAELTEEIKEAGASDMEKFFFYGLGAFCIFGAIGILLVIKNISYAAIAAGGGLFFCTVPFFLDLLYELLGPLKWIILVIIVAVAGSFLLLLFAKVKSILYDLTHHDEDDVHAETIKIRKSAKGWKSMSSKFKKTIGLE